MKFTIQNQCALLNPNSGMPITGDRIYFGDFVCGEWYDTGNETMAQRICDALNSHAALVEAARNALKFAEETYKQTGDAIPGSVCFTLRTAIATATPGMVQHQPTNLPMDSLEEHYRHTHPDFQIKLERIAALAQLTPLAVFAYWREYSKACADSDQSAVLGEFIEWYHKQLGGDRAALQLAIQD